MFRLLMRRLRFLSFLLDEGPGHRVTEAPILPALEQNLQKLTEDLGHSPDLIVRRFALKLPGTKRAAVVFIDGLADKTIIDAHILKPLMLARGDESKGFSGNLIFIQDKLLTVGEVSKTDSLVDVIDSVLSGDTALLLDGSKEGLLISSPGWEKRGISEPDTEVVIKGPHDGFTETLRTNTAMLRRKLRHPSLTFEPMTIGKRSRTQVCLAYVKGLANDSVVEEVRRRLKRIDTDAILAGGFLDEFISDAPLSPFPTVSYTERPDVCAAKLLEGRVGIMLQGTPLVNTVPSLLVEDFQTPDDYNFRPFYSSLVRFFRYIAFTISLLVPALYIAISTYQRGLIPTRLLITMAAAEEGTPFPAVVEVLGMGLVFEILREAGIRLPRAIGSAVSIVGALVIGETAVSAGLVGAPVVIVTALTAISSFVVPKLNDVGVLTRLMLTILAAAFGLPGVIMGLALLWAHVNTLRSFGVPILAPLSPLTPQDLKDVAIRAPLWAMFTRPRAIGQQDVVRQEPQLKPKPPQGTEE